MAWITVEGSRVEGMGTLLMTVIEAGIVFVGRGEIERHCIDLLQGMDGLGYVYAKIADV